MLIKALCDYYDLKVEQSRSDLPEGYSVQKIHYQVLLRENGEIAAINDYCETKETTLKNGKVKVERNPRNVALPKREGKSATHSELIEHRPLYLFGLNYSNGALDPEGENKARKSHEAFVKRNLEFFADLDSPICTAYRNFVNNWVPEEQTENEHLKGLGKNYSNSTYFTFALYDDITKSPQNDPQFIAKFQKTLSEQKAKAASGYSAVCPVLGERLPTARIHDKIKFPGGNTTGCSLVSMDKPAYESFGKKQSYNSNISEAAMKKYTAAFNDLLADSKHRIFINSMVVVFFALKKNDDAEAAFFSALFGGDDNEAFVAAMESLKVGKAVDYSKLNIDENVDFYVAGFTPNSSRICQKFIAHNSFGKIMENVSRHQRDMALSGNDRHISFGGIAKELISPKSTKEEIPPPLMAGIIRAAAEGVNYPEAMLQTTVMRVKTDRNEEKKHHNEEKKHHIKFDHVRVGIIKACLNRKARRSNKEEEITMALNKENTNPAYLCGRLFAVLEKLQQDAAEGTLNTTIVDSYFSSACSKPSTVFPKLVELSNHHIKKVGGSFFKSLIGEIIDPLDGEFPTTFSLDDQGRFIVGYYQQNRELWTSKKNKDNDEKEN